MSSWAQQRESIRRAVEAGASARTSGQGSELLRLPSGQQLLLSRPNGQPTRAGQFYYQLAGRRAPSRRFNENQQLVRDGPNDYIYLRGGTKKLVRSLQPDGNYRVTKLGKSFFRDKWTDYLAHMPVRIRGRRRNGRPYERETLLPVTLDGLGRQNDSLGEVQAHRNVIAAALRKMGDPEDGAVVMEISEETYTYDASRDWAVSKQTMQVVDNRVETEVALNRRLGVLRDVSYQLLFRGSEILESAFEQREDRLCVVRQLSELLRLPYDEVYSDFDAICPKNWERKGVTGAEIREFCVSLYIVNCRGQMLDCYEPAVREQRPVACCIYRDHAFFYRNAGAVSFCDGEARDQPSYRGDRRESTVPLFREWKQWRGEIEPGHFWCEDVRVVRAELLGQGHQPKVAMRGLVEWRYLRLRAKGGDCVVHEYPEDAEVLEKWMTKLDFGYRGQRLAAAASEVFAALLKARRDRGDVRELLLEQQGLCALCGTPIEAATAEADHVVPVHQAFYGQRQALQALCLECHRSKTFLESSHATSLESRFCRYVHETYACSPRLPPLVCGLAKCDPDRVCQGVDIVRCRKNALANAPFPLPAAEEGHLADLTFVRKKEDRRAGLAGRLPYVGPGWYGKPARRPSCSKLGSPTGRTSSGPWTPPPTSRRTASPGRWRSWKEPGPRARSTWPSSPSTLSSDSGPGPRFYSMRTSNHEVDGRGCQYQQVFFDDRGQCHYDHVYATEPPGAARGAASLPGGDEDRLPGLSEPSAKVRACGGGADQAAPPGQHAEVSLRGGEATGGRVPGAAAGDGAADGAGALAPRGGSRGALPQRPQPPVVRHAGDRQDAPGEADRVAALAARRRGHPDLQDALQRAEPRLGAQTADHWVRKTIRAGRCSLDWLVVEEVTQLDVGLWADIAELSTNRRVRFLLLGDFRQLPAVQDAFGGAPVLRTLKESQLLHDLAGGCVHELTENRRSDERIFRFLQYLRVDEAEQVPLRDAVQVAPEQFPMRGLPDTCLVISHAHRMAINDQENRRLAPEGAVLLEHRAQGPAGTNQPQTMRLWPGLRLVGAGGRVPKGCFVTVREAGERIVLDDGQSFTPAELLRSTRLCHAITYASCQGLTLRGRVWLCDTLNPHFSVKHLYVGASRCTGAERLSVL